LTVKSFLMIPNRKIPAVGKASYGRDFLFEQKSCENFGCSKINRKFAAKNNNEELWKKNYRLYI